jgi:nucleotide-binding universal stress UspA family protein
MIRIVLGTAGGPGSERAAAWTAELARLVNGSLEIVAGYARLSAEESPEVAHELDMRALDSLQRWAVAHQLATVPRQTMPSTPDEALTLAARDGGADLVVIGSEDEEGVTSLGLGSIAHRLAHHLRCPLIVVPPGDTTVEGGTIIVGVDGSTGSELALQWASRLGIAIDGRVVAVSSVDEVYETLDSNGHHGTDEPTSVKPLRVGGANFELIERSGSDPAATLRDVAAEVDAALIVVSAKLHHSLGGLLLGAVADHLLHRPTRPVAVLPHGYRGWAAAPTPNGAAS